MLAACGLDRLLGDPSRWLHPVQIIGAAIEQLRRWAEAWAGDRPLRLRLAGVAITLVVVGVSAAAGWALEQLARLLPWLGLPLLLLGLASALAGRSLALAVEAVLQPLEALPPQLALARQRLALIVGRDVQQLPAPELLRAAAETAAENGVDGLFAPLFWMLLGAGICGLLPLAPGPLALAWAFKASSTLDSMLGYRQGRLRWLGTAGARLDDLLTWIPCRLTALSLGQLLPALADGAADPSPNAGVSEAAYAHQLGIRLGGDNYYGGMLRAKPLLNASGKAVSAANVRQILGLNRRICLLWLLISGVIAATSQGLKL